MHVDDVQIRCDICEACRRECGVRATIDHADPCACCPAREWHAFGNCEAEPSVEDGIGLGDVVAAIAKPFARGIDTLTGGRTDLEHCAGCAARQASWNKVRIARRKRQPPSNPS